MMIMKFIVLFSQSTSVAASALYSTFEERVGMANQRAWTSLATYEDPFNATDAR